jgi:hypothetical protein
MTFYDDDHAGAIESALRFLARDCRGEWKYRGAGFFEREGPSEDWERGYLTATLVLPIED